MRPWLSLTVILFVGAWLLMGCSTRQEAAVRTTVENAAKAAEEGLNRRNLDSTQSFFATEAEGANIAGLAGTWGALQALDSGLTASDRVQFHSFDVEEVAVHDADNLARATYRLHLSVLRDNQVMYSLVVTQNLALTRTARGWRISGGDQAQLSDVVGQWPLPSGHTTNP